MVPFHAFQGYDAVALSHSPNEYHVPEAQPPRCANLVFSRAVSLGRPAEFQGNLYLQSLHIIQEFL